MARAQPPAPAGVHYRIAAPDPRNHLFQVTLTVAQPAAAQELVLPVWIPGSYLVRDKAPAAATCDTSALQRNLAFGRKHKITGTPTLIFTDGSRVPGAIGAKDVEKRLAEAAQ